MDLKPSTVYGLLALLAVAGCESAPEPPGAWTEAGTYRWRALAGLSGEGTGFTALDADRTGVDFVNEVAMERRLQNQLLTHGSGVAIGDVDGDGLPDLLLGRVDGPAALYRNLGNWRFEDVTREAGVALEGRDVTGVALADVDGDGDLDALIAARGQANALLLNDGGGRFTDVSSDAGFDDSRGATSMALADVDGDGDLDAYVANYKRLKAGNAFPPQARTFDQVVKFRDGEYVVEPDYREFYRAYLEPEGVRLWQHGEPDIFLLNDGSGRFTPVDWMGGRFLMHDGQVLDSLPEEWGLSARFQDVNRDGAPDLYVANDFESPDQFWINQGDGTFREIDPLALRTTSASSMAVDFSDVNRDGTVDFLLLDMLSRDPVKRRTQMPTLAPRKVRPGEIEPRLQRNRNTFFRQRKDGTFAEVAHAAGLEASGWSWGTVFMDVDLDGFEDALVTTGHYWDVLDADINERLTNTVVDDDWQEVVNNFPRLEVPNAAFRNMGDGTFREAADEWGFDAGPDLSHGIATGDMDQDGDLDVVVTRMGAPVLLFRSDATAPRIAVQLAGPGPNTRGIGARVRLLGAEVSQEEEIIAGGLYLSSPEPLASFAAVGDGPFTLEVHWPFGGVSVVEDVQPGRLYEIRADGAAPGPVAPSEEGTLFRSRALPYVHTDLEYNDFVRQPLLDHRLSQLGPGVTFHDADRDGDPDLFVTTGAGGRMGYLRNEGGSFRPTGAGPEEVRLDQTAVLPVPGPEGASLLVGRSNYQAENPERAQAAAGAVWLRPSGASVVRVGEAVPPAAPAVGPLAAGDLDGDGSLEVLVASRGYPAVYPRPAPSRIFRMQDGELVEDEALSRTLANVGLVSGAVFADLDADGDQDLVLALDWGRIRSFTNYLGRLTDATGDWGLAQLPGRWNGVSPGDFDGDGDLDLVVTSWGRNTPYHPTPEQPLKLYWGDFDGTGAMDLLLASVDESGRERPVVDLARLSQAVPTVRTSRTRTFQAYATATVPEILGPQAMAGAQVKEAVTLDHLVLVNDGGRFVPRSLPAVAQEAPAFHPAVGDLDGDGREDLLLTQNFYPNEVNAQRFASGRGLVLLGDGEGGFTPMSGSASGVKIYGDQRGGALADVNGDGRLDAVVGQNAGPAVLLLNQGARPGLRVRLQGPPGNPRVAGAVLRVVYADGTMGPARAVTLGSGYWSVDGAVEVLGLRSTPEAVEIRWPGGEVTRVPVAGEGEVSASWDGPGA